MNEAATRLREQMVSNGFHGTMLFDKALAYERRAERERIKAALAEARLTPMGFTRTDAQVLERLERILE